MPRSDPSWFVRATDGKNGFPDDVVRGRQHLIGGVTPPLPLRRIDQPPSSPKVLALLRHLQVMAAVVLMDGVRPREQEVASGDEGPFVIPDLVLGLGPDPRSEEHTSELQSLMRISYAVFCLKKKKTHHTIDHTND